MHTWQPSGGGGGGGYHDDFISKQGAVFLAIMECVDCMNRELQSTLAMPKIACSSEAIRGPQAITL